MQIEALTTQLQNMQRTPKQKRRNYEIIEIFNLEQKQNEATQTEVLVYYDWMVK